MTMVVLKRCPLYGKCSDDEGNDDNDVKVPWVRHLRGQRRDNQRCPSHLWLCSSQWLSKVYLINLTIITIILVSPIMLINVTFQGARCRRHYTYYPYLQIFRNNYLILMVLDLRITWFCSCDRGGCGTNACSGIPGQYCRFQTHHQFGILGRIYIEFKNWIA